MKTEDRPVARDLHVGARDTGLLVRDDVDAYALLEELERELVRVLAFCLMNTHLHLLSLRPDARACLERALAAYGESFHARHGEPLVLRGPIDVRDKSEPAELGRTIHYFHQNPTRTKRPVATRAVDFWRSSARSFAGLARTPFVDVASALALLGKQHVWRIRLDAPSLVLERERARARPVHSPGLLLSAAAQAHGLAPRALGGSGRSDRLREARALFVRAGLLEGHSLATLARWMGRSEGRASQLARTRLDPRDVRIVRTLLADDALLARLGDVEPSPRVRASGPARAVVACKED